MVNNGCVSKFIGKIDCLVSEVSFEIFRGFVYFCFFVCVKVDSLIGVLCKL